MSQNNISVLFFLLTINIFLADKNRPVEGKVQCLDSGCSFNDTNPLKDYVILPRDDPDKTSASFETMFRLYTVKKKKEGERISAKETRKVVLTQKTSSFNPRNPTVFIIHGFLANGKKSWVMKMKQALLERGDYNVITVNWEEGAEISTLYLNAVVNTEVVGKEIAKLIEKLCDNYDVKPDSFHLIGHSLGAHVAGHAGRNLREKGLKLGRISGLDPAGPLFRGTQTYKRLDKTDAEFVDVIHTDIRGLLGETFAYGIAQPSGTVDFYPNGGYHQPGCMYLKRSSLEFTFCSHARVHYLYIESIKRTCDMNGYPCSSWENFKNGKCNPKSNEKIPVMGFDVNKKFTPQGKYFLYTTDERPYCLKHFRVTLSYKILGTVYAWFSWLTPTVRLYFPGTKHQPSQLTFSLRSKHRKVSELLFLYPETRLEDISKAEMSYTAGKNIQISSIKIIPLKKSNRCYEADLSKPLKLKAGLYKEKYTVSIKAIKTCSPSEK